MPAYLEVARRDGLDFAIGSKRHPDSVVHYPRSRRIASWCYQQLNRLLFRLDVRDTQVGLKVFNRRVVDEVVPLLLVKQFAFDLELLAVAAALGFDRVREMPVRLEYRFTGSALGSTAVLRALWDTAAVFYRLRILRTYQRKRRLLGARRPRSDDAPLVSVVGDDAAVATLDYPRARALRPSAREAPRRPRRGAATRASVRPATGSRAAVPYFADPDVAAVVVADARAAARHRWRSALRRPCSSRASAAARGARASFRATCARHRPSGRERRRAASTSRAATPAFRPRSSSRGSRREAGGRSTRPTRRSRLRRLRSSARTLDDVLRHARARGLAARRTRGAQPQRCDGALARAAARGARRRCAARRRRQDAAHGRARARARVRGSARAQRPPRRRSVPLAARRCR